MDRLKRIVLHRRTLAVSVAVAVVIASGTAIWWWSNSSPRDRASAAYDIPQAASPTDPSASADASASASPSASTSASASKSAAARAPAPPPGGFPNASTTGVQRGVALRDAATDTEYYDRNKKLYFGKDNGQLIQNLEINGQIHVSADNVTIRNVKVNCNNGALAGAIHQGLGAENLTIEHVTIIGSKSVQCQYGVLSSAKKTKVRFSNISLVTDAINPYGDVLVEGNYVHDLTFFPGDHVAAFGFDGGNAGIGPIVIRNNTFDDPNNDGNNLIALYSQNGPVVDTTIDGNWLAGSGHIMWAGGFPAVCANSSGVRNVKITNNRFSTKYWPDGGSFGAVVGWCPTAPGNVWSNNLWIDGPKAGQPVNPVP